MFPISTQCHLKLCLPVNCCLRMSVNSGYVSLKQLTAFLKVHIILTGGDSLVSSTRSSTRILTVLMSNWHVVHWVHLCWNGNKETTVSRRFRNWPIVSHIQVTAFPVILPMTLHSYMNENKISSLLLTKLAGVSFLSSYSFTKPWWSL